MFRADSVIANNTRYSKRSSGCCRSASAGVFGKQRENFCFEYGGIRTAYQRTRRRRYDELLGVWNSSLHPLLYSSASVFGVVTRINRQVNARWRHHVIGHSSAKILLSFIKFSLRSPQNLQARVTLLRNCGHQPPFSPLATGPV